MVDLRERAARFKANERARVEIEIDGVCSAGDELESYLDGYANAVDDVFAALAEEGLLTRPDNAGSEVVCDWCRDPIVDEVVVEMHVGCWLHARRESVVACDICGKELDPLGYGPPAVLAKNGLLTPESQGLEGDTAYRSGWEAAMRQQNVPEKQRAEPAPGTRDVTHVYPTEF